uniref:tRNA-splicing endonuclease subunit Sen54 N-terminal domain-containing protein n=1 Tax=Davidia involucrata TaxID=16924 RepID=A0A5B6Z5S1_DAVIN
MEVEDWSSSSGGTSDSEVCLQDLNDGEHCYTSGDIHKLQFRKDISKARWNDELGMAEIVDNKGRMWTTTGIVCRSKVYCSVEETLFLAEAGALHLLDDNDTLIPLKNIYKKVAEGKSGCCWESFEVYRHLKSLGYIVRRHGIPWTMEKSVKSKSVSLQGMPEINGVLDKESEDKNFIIDLFNNMKINELRPLFDVYPPNSKFKKSSPGNPSFVLCLPGGHPPSKPEIEDLERQCNGIPLKFCCVEYGRVSFFSFNKVELPALP